MYEELVKQCRDCLDSLCGDCKYEHLQKPGNFVPCMNALLGETADVIEKLSKKRVGTWHRFKATQRSYSFVCNSCGSMFPYLTRCCPNCGVEYINEEPPKEGKT